MRIISFMLGDFKLNTYDTAQNTTFDSYFLFIVLQELSGPENHIDNIAGDIIFLDCSVKIMP